MSFEPQAYASLVANGPSPVFATISGAHLYGFESLDSDVDIRGAFALPLDARLSLRDPQETHEVSEVFDGVEVDWVAHDIRKFSRMLTKRNGYVLEQLFSPLVVFDAGWLTPLRDVASGCIVRHHYHHYRGFSHNKLEEVQRPGATVKDLLYAYRVVLTGIHLLETGEVEANLTTLLERFDAPGVADLVVRKRSGREFGALEEGDAQTHVPALHGWITALETAFEASTLPDEVTSFDALDDLVIEICRACAVG